jgi:hypothetical protein
MDEKLKYALIIAFVLNAAFVLSNFQARTYDSYEHIFFANHYRTSWFDTWEPKWYGGFTVTSYPPLAHQAIALLSFAVGLEWSYDILTLSLMTIFPLAVYLFSKRFVSEKGAVYAGFISVFVPSILQAIYSFGQFPSLFGLVAGLFTIVYLSKFLVDGHWIDLTIALSLLGVTVSAHHFTAIFLVPMLVIVLVLDTFLRRKEIPIAKLLRRISIFVVLGIALCVLIIYPYWYFSLFNGINMTPIPHLTRENILFNNLGFELFFWNIYGSIIFLVPFFIILVLKEKRLFVLFLGGLILLILGLGGTTPLPQLLFGRSWEVLTYDRFGLWASVLFLPLIGQLFFEYRIKFKTKKVYKMLLMAFFAILILTGTYAATRSLEPGGISVSTIDPVVEFLNNPQTQSWRYLTLGLGEAPMLKLSVYANASNVDGYYYFVRDDPLLSKSGVGSLDTAKFYGEKGLTVLGEVLANASKYSLRWVICADPTYYPILKNNSFVERWSQDSTGDGRFGGTTIWEYNGTIPVYVPNKIQEENSPLNNYIWGIGPPLTLFATLLLLATKKIKKAGY